MNLSLFSKDYIHWKSIPTIPHLFDSALTVKYSRSLCASGCWWVHSSRS